MVSTDKGEREGDRMPPSYPPRLSINASARDTVWAGFTDGQVILMGSLMQCCIVAVWSSWGQREESCVLWLCCVD